MAAGVSVSAAFKGLKANFGFCVWVEVDEAGFWGDEAGCVVVGGMGAFGD
jgi:hypothetical protein